MPADQWIMAVGAGPRAHLALLAIGAAVLVIISAPTTRAFNIEALRDDRQADFDGTAAMDTAADQYVNMIKRYYRGWGHSSRFPWKRLPHEMCFREPCRSNRDCCYRWNICDKSAKVCVDCWYGSTCRSEQDCCSRYPYCARVWKKSREGHRYIASGKCVRKL